MGYHQLNSEERLELYRLRQETNLSMRAIAKKMGRSHTTISRELQRNQDPYLKTYLPDSANSQAQERRHNAQELFQSFTPQQIEEIRSRLKLYHSPEQIAGRLKKEGRFVISHETIYQMIYLNHQGLGECASYLRQSRRQRRRRSQSQAKRGVIPNRVGIEHRPPIADEKTDKGHWEGDTIIGANHFGAVVTYVDKASKFLVAQVMKKRTATELNLATHQAFSVIPTEFIQTFTFDNGKEFSFHETLSASLGVACFFANPYHPWERGLNEHTNGLLRQFFPKGTNFKLVKQSEVLHATNLLNHRPRKSLDYCTPYEVFFSQSGPGAVQT